MLQLGYVARANGNDAQAQQTLRESFDSFRADGQSVMRGLPALRLGELLYEQKDYVTAGIYLNHSLAIFEELGDPSRSCMALSHLGKLAMTQDDRVEVQKLLTKALLIKDRTAYLHALPQALDCMGRLAQWQGNYPQAYALHETCLLIWGERETHQTRHRVLGIEAFACLAARQGQLERAALLFGAAETLFAETPMQWNLLSVLQDPVLRAEHDRLLAHTRVQLGEAAFAAAWATGTVMDLDQAVKYALDTAPAIPSSSCA